MIRNKICVLGSSYIGAVYTAYREHKPATDRFTFDFYGHSHGGFSNVDIVDDHVQQVRFRSRKPTLPMSTYDAFVVYADLPSPHDISKITSACAAAGCSAQVTEATVRDVVRAKHSYSLYEKLVKSTERPVFLISCNVVSITQQKLSDERYKKNTELILKSLDPGVYIPFPDELFGENYAPRREYYNGSVLLTGQKAAEGESGHDNHHMNETGGWLVLKAIVERLDEAFAGRKAAD